MSGDDGNAFGIFIAGRWERRSETLERHNPARPDELVGSFADATQADVDAAYIAARGSCRAWARASPTVRGDVLRGAADWLEDRVDAIAVEVAEEVGKPLREARGEVARGAVILRYFSAEVLQPIGEVYPSADPMTLLYSTREPVGVVALITPWNFPIAIPAWKLGPALGFGNAVVWKPSELSSRAAVRIVQALEQAGLPPGVLNLVTGDPARIGPAVAGHAAVDRISFTGSVAVGRRLKAEAAARGVEVQAELGGKNPVIVLDDADVEHAAALTVSGAIGFSGQKCSATSRAIVLPGIRAAFTEAVVERVRALRMGDPCEERNDLGPVVSRAQLERIHAHIDGAAADGLVALTGGARASGSNGHFVAPAVFADVPAESRLGQEEVFGPVLALMAVRDLDEALAVANAVPFGLSASIFTRDVDAALRFVGDIEAGMVHVNSETPGAEPHAPFGGIKASGGVAREQGKAAAQFFTRGKTVSFTPTRR